MFKTDFEMQLLNKAKLLNKFIALPEVGYSKVVYDAGIMLANHNACKIVFLVKSDDELNQYGFTNHHNIEVVNINTHHTRNKVIETYYAKRKSKGITLEEAKEYANNELFYATLLLEIDYVEGVVCGAENTTANALKPALQIIKGKKSDSTISTFMIMTSENENIGSNGVFLLSDCGLNIEPDIAQLVDITVDTANSAKTLLGISPKIALLSYSTLGSAGGKDAEKMRAVLDELNSQNIDFIVDGEFQFDTAVDKSVAKKKAPKSNIQGDANVLIFPNLSSGNIAYKIMQRFAGFNVIGPLCQGLRKPVNDVSRGADVLEVARAVIITAIQAGNLNN